MTNLGSCAPCPEGTVPDRSRFNHCMKPTPPKCLKTEIFTEDKKGCIPCLDFTQANEDNTECVAHKCSYDNQYLSVEGDCKTCPTGTVSDESKKSCIYK